MPNDESYLDSLLNGLNSDGNKKEETDRFAAYKKHKVTAEQNDGVKPEKEIPIEETPMIEEQIMEESEELPEEITEDTAPVEEKPKKTKTEKKAVKAEKPKEAQKPQKTEKSKKQPELSVDEAVAAIRSVPIPEFEAGEIENYNIFDEYEDEVIDEIISNELSEERSSGELFAVSESDVDEEFAQETDKSSDESENLPETQTVIEEAHDPEIEPANETEFDFSGNTEEKSGADEEAALDALFGSLFDDKDSNYDGIANHAGSDIIVDKENDEFKKVDEATKSSDDSDFNYDGFDFLNQDGSDMVTDSNMEEHLADEVSDIEEDDNKPELADSEDIFALTDDGTEPAVFEEDGSLPVAEEMPEFNDLFSTEEEEENSSSGDDDPMSGFTFNADENSDEEQEENVGLGGMLGDMGVDTLNEDDLAALDNLFNEIDIDKPDEEGTTKTKKVKAVKDKLPWYIRLFGNVKIPENQIKPEPTPEEIEKKKAEAAEAKKALKEAKKAEKAAKKKEIAEAKALKARQTAEEKELARKKKLEQASAFILEDVGNTTKLNKWGILVIFALFIGIVAVTVSGGSTLAYNIGVRQATKYFDNALIYRDVNYYTKAYDKIYGLDIEEEDYEIYDKILTVNYVNTQLNAYNNHAKLDDYREGLNDLFKGLLRFRKWFAHAAALGAQDDIYLVRSEILNRLWDNYGIDEAEAMFVLEHYDALKSSYSEYEANLYYTRYIYETVDRLGLGFNQ